MSDAAPAATSAVRTALGPNGAFAQQIPGYQPREPQIAMAEAVEQALSARSLLLQGSLHPALLRDQVTSPGGTTIAGLAALESRAFRSACIEAVRAAARRSRELA